MKISVAASEFPDPEGSAAGRDLWSWCEGAIALGHNVDVWSWRPATPSRPLPPWCRWEPCDPRPLWRAHVRSMVRPRHEPAYMGWEPAPGAIAVADHVPSFPAVARFPRSVVNVHYRALNDARAVRRVSAGDVQTARCELRAGRRASLVLAYSSRVASHLRRPAIVVPIGYPVPHTRLDPVDEPVAALVADWSWRPNRLSLTWLLAMWPAVRDLVPSARLLVAGRHLERSDVGTVPGVEILGAVKSSVDVLGRAAVVPFPCPTSSGPKVKVIEALSYGLPVVTTPSGVEGIFGGPDGGTVVADRSNFVPTLAALLTGPERRAGLGAAGRKRVERHHAPRPAALARLEAFADAFREDLAASLN